VPQKEWNDAADLCAHEFNLDAKAFKTTLPLIGVMKQDIQTPPPAASFSSASARIENSRRSFTQALKFATAPAILKFGRGPVGGPSAARSAYSWVPRRIGRS
jgi:hypothetical protein